jgi:hypothetical protein
MHSLQKRCMHSITVHVSRSMFMQMGHLNSFKVRELILVMAVVGVVEVVEVGEGKVVVVVEGCGGIILEQTGRFKSQSVNPSTSRYSS